jgi:hypothetical protein
LYPFPHLEARCVLKLCLPKCAQLSLGKTDDGNILFSLEYKEIKFQNEMKISDKIGKLYKIGIQRILGTCKVLSQCQMRKKGKGLVVCQAIDTSCVTAAPHC